MVDVGKKFACINIYRYIFDLDYLALCYPSDRSWQAQSQADKTWLYISTVHLINTAP